MIILRPDIVPSVSWRAKRVMYNGEIRKCPAVCRIISIQSIWWKYGKEESLIPYTRKLRRTLFVDLVKEITKGDGKSPAYIDYILNVLVYENFENVWDVVEREIVGTVKLKYFLTKLEVVQDFQK